MKKMPQRDHWENDLLDYRAVGQTFSNVIAFFDEAKVISIEAGFGRGKTFFRKAWAEDLRQRGEVVIEIDAQQSDHSGDPVVSFIGALIGALPEKEKDIRQDAYEKGKKIAGLAARTVIRVAARHAAEDIIETMAERAADKVDGLDGLENAVREIGNDMSKLAGSLIAGQMAAEQVRKKELPAQLNALHKALTTERGTKRVVIIIDELDRCHPEYAIALLEAMKLVFDHPGFVFCLMINAEYLEKLAEHRFGTFTEGEKYLDKFVDLRLQLPKTEKALRAATRYLAKQLPLEIPFGDTDDFSLEKCAEVASNLAVLCGFSMRQIKRVLLRVELAFRCYRDIPLDGPLLILLAFNDASGRNFDPKVTLPRAALTPEVAKEFSKPIDHRSLDSEQKRNHKATDFIQRNCPELRDLPEDRYKSPPLGRDRRYLDWVPICTHLAEHYIPNHQAILDAVRELEAG